MTSCSSLLRAIAIVLDRACADAELALRQTAKGGGPAVFLLRIWTVAVGVPAFAQLQLQACTITAGVCPPPAPTDHHMFQMVFFEESACDCCAVVAAAHTCAAHQIALNNANIVWVSHLDFQEIYPGYFQGLIQKQAGDFLSNQSQWQDPGLLVSAIMACMKTKNTVAFKMVRSWWCVRTWQQGAECSAVSHLCPLVEPDGSRICHDKMISRQKGSKNHLQPLV